MLQINVVDLSKIQIFVMYQIVYNELFLRKLIKCDLNIM